MAEAGLLVFSPPRRGDTDKENRVPVLSFTWFSKPPVVTFGTVKVGFSKSALLQVENPSEEAAVTVKVEGLGPEKGFSIDHREFTVEPESAFSLCITWTPVKGGGVRELIYFNASGPRKYQAVLLGTAEEPHSKKRSQWDTRKSRKESGNAARQHRRTKLPSSVLCPTVEPGNSGNVSARSNIPGRNRKNKGVSKTPDKALVPFRSQEGLRNVMPSVQSDMPFLSTLRCQFTDAQIPSLKEALAAIQSDLDISSACELSDSLGPGRGRHGLPDSPQLVNINEQRLTFFVSQKGLGSEKVKVRFTSATVTKGKAPLEAEANRSGKKRVKKSRRRLLDKTLELSFSSSEASSPRVGTPSLPVIEPGTGVSACDDHPVLKSSPSNSTLQSLSVSPLLALPSFSFRPSTSPALSTIPLPLSSSSPLHFMGLLDSENQEQMATVPQCSSVKEDLFPVPLTLNTKKRKSEEHLLTDQNVGKIPKKTQLETRQRVKEKRGVTPGQKKAESVCATSTRKTATKSRLSTQAKHSNSRAVSQGASLKRTKMVAVAQSKLTFIKPVQTALPRHPMPFAAKNMFYDERWMEKQERGFTWWINYVLTPDDFRVNNEVNKDTAVSLAIASKAKLNVHEAPTKEEMSFSTYTARRKLNRLRRSACQMFMSEAMAKAIQRLELEVEAGRLRVRPDRHLWKDIGERKKVLNWLLSYNPLWLRIGLETIYGEMISLQSNSDTLGLAMFILQRLLWNPDIAAKFRHPSVAHLYKEGHEEALSRFTLKKLLLLVCFLDKAKESRLIEHNPCLFCVDAEFKTSKDLLLAFSRDFLSGEGILSRHLSYLGLPVSHAQKPLDEFNFAVKNLAVDLRCGVRLVRVMELFLQDWSLSQKLRMPTVSRLQKVHNVDIALLALKSKGVDLKDERGSTIESRDIVDGHREKTLGLLWKILLAFHLDVILDEDELKEEISFLKDTIRTKRRLDSLKGDQGPPPDPAEETVPFKHSNKKITLLMDWVCAVCDFYRLMVENFTVSFSDGRVLCYLIHHYHPGLLPSEAISHSTTQTVECSVGGHLELDHSSNDPDASSDSLTMDFTGPDSQLLEFHNLLQNEKNNFRAFNTAVAYLGGVPAMMNPADMSNTIPNEKVVISHLSFLCARLLDLRKESRAARVIQNAWRKYKLREELKHYKDRNIAAVKIQKAVRSFLQRRRSVRQNRAAVTIQSLWRGHSVRNQMRLEREAGLRAEQHEAATIIQARWRGFSAKRAYLHLKHCATLIKAQWKMKRAASEFQKIRHSAIVIQKYSRAWALSKRGRSDYLRLRTAAVTVQRAYRKWKAQKTHQEDCAARVIQSGFKKWFEERTVKKSAAVRIQSRYRMKMCLQKYRSMKRSAVLIQAQYRGSVQRRRFQVMKVQHSSAVVIQSAFRGYVVRQQVAKMIHAVILIQRHFRACLMMNTERKMYLRMRCAAVTIQAAYRGKMSRDSLKEQGRAATIIQAAFRRRAVQRRYCVLKNAAVTIQRKYRAAVLARGLKHQYESLRNAALTVQSHWRGRAARKWLENRNKCATLIQTCYRRHKAQLEFKSKKAAAVVLQRHYRALVSGREMRIAYLQKKAMCLTLQAAFRGMRVRAEFRRKHQAATVIQSSVRMFLCQKKYFLLQSAAIVLQSRYRALLLCRSQHNEFSKLKKSTIRIQAAFRGYKVRDNLAKMHHAATVIQRRFRMYRARRSFLTLKCAATLLQHHYRAKVLKDRQVHTYKAMKRAAVAIQAAYRGHLVRKKVAFMHQAATIIQRKFTTIRERRRFLVIKAAALVCQRRYRAVTLAREHRLDYLLKRRAAVCLQAAYRGYKERKQLRTKQTAAVTIQSHFRKYQQRKDFLRLRWASSVLQSRYRANKQMRRDMLSLSVKRNAAIVLQAALRGMKTRQILKRRHQAATVIQRAHRAHCERERYLRLKSSVLAMQRRYRANVAMKKERKVFEQTVRAAIVLQSVYRGRLVRKDLACRHHAATVIQCAFRKHRDFGHFQAVRTSAIIIQRRYRSHIQQLKAQQEFRSKKAAAVVLQRHYRALVSGREMRIAYLQKKAMCLTLQAAFRGMRVRAEFRRKHQAATVIQSSVRMFLCQKKFFLLQRAAIVLQSRYRALLLCRSQHNEFSKLKKSTIRIQAAFRGYKVRDNLAKMHHAATVIQRRFRMYRARRSFLTLKCAATLLQHHYRAKVLKDRQVHTYKAMKRAAVAIQAAYRGHLVRKKVAFMHQAATIIQRKFTTIRERRRFLVIKAAALVCQRRYRAVTLAREHRLDYLLKRRAAVCLQAAYRGYKERKQLRTKQTAAVTIQSHFRKYQQRKDFLRLRWASSVLQSRYRANKQMRRDMLSLSVKRNAAIVLQAALRGMKTRQILKRRHQAASVIQRAHRAHCERERYLRLKSSVLAVQCRYRANVAMKKERKVYEQTVRAAIVLQSVYRGQLVRKDLACRHHAATVIQCAFRKHRDFGHFQAVRTSAIIIQRRYRSFTLQRQQQERFRNLKRSVTVLQAAFRAWCVRRDIRRQNQAALVIQSCWKGSVQRRIFRRKKEAAVKLQQTLRAVLLGRAERTGFIQKREAAIILQKHCRAWIIRRQELEVARSERRLRFTSAAFHHLSAIRVQRAVRVHLALKSAKRQIHNVVIIQRWLRARWQRKQFLQDRRKVVLVQRAVRSWLARRGKAACIIQQAVRRFVLVRRQKRAVQGIIKAQALWRGHGSRRLNDNPALVVLRHRLRQVTAAAREEDKLYNKTLFALHHLLHYKQFSYILEALKNLETATRLSPECCERLLGSGVANVIFTLIRSCNRSIASMEVITFSVQILLNLSKYHKTLDMVYSVENSVETLLDLLQKYRDKAGDKVAGKGGSIFTRACFILAILLQDQRHAREVLKQPCVVDRVRSIYHLTVRKHKMDTQRAIIKNKMSASSVFTATPHKTRPQPKFAPDWVLRRDKLKDINDPLRAIQMVADALLVV